MDSWPYIGIVLLIMLSAFFSGSEIAFASVNKARLKKASQAGKSSAKIALYITEHFEDALSTILIGNNLVNIAASSISTVIAIGLMGESGTIAATLIMTVVILTFGEITPKIIAKQQCDKFVLLASYPLRFLMVIMKPVIAVVVWIVNLISKIWEKDGQKEPSVTEEELVSIIEIVEDDGIIDKDRSELLQSALEFSDISVEEILTPRTDMVAIDIDDDMDTIVDIALNSPYSRIPVYEDTIDNIIGVLYLGRFLKKLVDEEPVNIRSMLIEACFVHKTMKLPAIFAELKRRRLQLAIVTDEYGGTMGCITMEDVLEQLVGDIWDETDEIINEFVIIGENTYEVSGDLTIRDFFEYVDIDDRDFESQYSTVGGWTIEMLNGLPNTGDTFRYKNMTIKVIELDGMRITRLSVVVAPEADED
ncbi:hemolysin family protein [Lutispora sp.]|uniref:hemolysin family protein n=1 Tax=Lutispora sp. TaxID=2828727 RepID=UPI002B1FBA0C|nr:hemolysin family protein [Lutispora sp.]MEA4962569.1 hemolysin family protein [Lutispora sp.]